MTNENENLSSDESGAASAPSETLGARSVPAQLSDDRPDAVVWRAGYCDHVNQTIHDYVECVIDYSGASRYHDPSKRSSVDRLREMSHQVDKAKTAMIVAILTYCELRDTAVASCGDDPSSERYTR